MLRDFISVNDVNQKLETNRFKLMLDAESNYRGQLFKVVNLVLRNRRKYKILLLGGPSCGGKTTTANLLKEIFENKGRRAIVVSMDDFFFDREATPLLPNGTKDFDSLRAVNLEQMQACFKELFSKGKAMFPVYDFKTGLNIADHYSFDYKDKPIIIMEGIHVLNPDLINHLGTSQVFKMYISTFSGFKGSKGITMSTRQVRLVRRIIRDAERRGYSPEHTLKSWKNVCDGEDSYIAPYKDNVNYSVNTTHTYELALYKSELFRIACENREVLTQLPFLDLFDESLTLEKEKLPPTSLMWEFLEKPESVDENKKTTKKKKNKD